MRTDARRNRERLLDASVAVILEVGGEPPLDAIARRAGVGIGTLYRHFPDRERLLGDVAQHVLAASIEAAEAALATGSNGVDSLRTYMHEAVRRGVGVLNLIHPLLANPTWPDARERITTLLDAIVQRGTSDGSLRADVHALDVVFAVIRFCRPVALGLAEADERAIAHRHLDIYVDGLAAVAT